MDLATSEAERLLCRSCHGTGVVMKHERGCIGQCHGSLDMRHKCSECKGTGRA